MGEQSPEQKRKISPALVVGIILTAICGVSVYLRIYLSWDSVFVGGSVWLRETDAYYYLRHIEGLVNHFPRFNSFDPYWIYPGGGPGLVRPLFAWLVAATTLIVSRGAPTQHLIEVVSVLMPPILGTLTLIPVYFIGKELFNRWVGLIAAALVAILPGEFLHRSLLGFTDHHVAEVLFSTLCILFLIMAIKRAREREISFSHILSRDWSTITKPLVYTLLAGIFLGFYLLSWAGGLLVVLLMFTFLVIQFIVDHLRRKSTDYLCIVGTPAFLMAFLMLLLALGSDGVDTINRLGLSTAVAVPVVLSLVSRFMAGKAWKPSYYPLTLLGLAGIGLAAFHAINPSLFQSILGMFSIFAPAGARLTIMEVRPLLFPGDEFSFAMAWHGFTTSFFISFISLAMLVYVAVKERSADKVLLLVWSLVMLIAVLGQRRFSYYYAVNAALLTGYFSWRMLDIAGSRKLLAKPSEVLGPVKKFKKKERKAGEKARQKAFMHARAAWVRVIVVGIIIFFLVFFPVIPSARTLGGMPTIMERGWYESLLWLRTNSPEPFGDPNFYYEVYPSQDEFVFPETAYGVMSWWDYGYFIMQIARRIPNANPSQTGAREAGKFFTAQNESAARQIVDRYGLGTKYVVISFAMAKPYKFHAMAEWAGRRVDEFYDFYLVQRPDGRWEWQVLFYSAYYRSTVVRLYNFQGKAVVPTQAMVISFEVRQLRGLNFKVVTWAQPFPTYEDAGAFVRNQTRGNFRIVGDNPLRSIVPLEEMKSYRLIHQSQTVRPVKIFKYLGSGVS